MGIKQAINAAFGFVLRGQNDEADAVMAPYKVEPPRIRKFVRGARPFYRCIGWPAQVAEMTEYIFKKYPQAGYGTNILSRQQFPDGTEEVVITRGASCE